MAEYKVQTLLEWTPPMNVMAVQSFLGFANFYRRFIKGFSKICKPLTDLTKKGIRWQWTEEAQNAFEMLKRWFTMAPLLKHFDPALPTVMETDASDFAIVAVLSQQVEARLHPVAFHSRKMDKAEINYEPFADLHSDVWQKHRVRHRWPTSRTRCSFVLIRRAGPLIRVARLPSFSLLANDDLVPVARRPSFSTLSYFSDALLV